jgi:hypothetical protein
MNLSAVKERQRIQNEKNRQAYHERIRLNQEVERGKTKERGMK